MKTIMKVIATVFTAIYLMQVIVVPTCAIGIKSVEKLSVPSDAKEYNGHYYKVFNKNVTWSEAKKACVQIGGHLVSVANYQEESFICGLTAAEKFDTYFIGGSKRALSYSWVTGEYLTYTDWYKDNMPEGARYLALYHDGIGDEDENSGWIGVDESYRTGYICEWNGVTFNFSGYDAQRGYALRSHTFCYSDSYFDASAYTYNDELAKVSLGLACTAFTSADRTGTTHIKNAFAQMRFPQRYIRTYKYDAPHNNSDSTAAYAIAKKNLPDGSTLIAIAIRGGYYGCEWSDNMNVGNTAHHEGFYAAAEDVMKNLNAFKVTLGRSTKIKNVKYWITGYSRGAAVANILAAMIDDTTDCNNVYAYTFATPRTVNIYAYPHAASKVFDNIFNICFDADAVTQVVMSKWYFGRYGTTVSLNSDMNKKDLRKTGRAFYLITSESMDFSQFAGQREVVEDLADEIAEIFGSQENYYERYQQTMMDFLYLYECRLDREYESISEKYIAIYGNDDDFARAGNDLKSDFILYQLLTSGSAGNAAEYAQVLLALSIKNGHSFSEIKKHLPLLKIVRDYFKFREMSLDRIIQAHRPEVYLAFLFRDEYIGTGGKLQAALFN